MQYYETNDKALLAEGFYLCTQILKTKFFLF